MRYLPGGQVRRVGEIQEGIAQGREKRFTRQHLSNLREYLLVSPARREVKIFRRKFELPLDLSFEEVEELSV